MEKVLIQYLKRINNILNLSDTDITQIIYVYEIIYLAGRHTYSYNGRYEFNPLEENNECLDNPKYFIANYCPTYEDDWYENEIFPMHWYNQINVIKELFDIHNLLNKLNFNNKEVEELTLTLLKFNEVKIALKYTLDKYNKLLTN